MTRRLASVKPRQTAAPGSDRAVQAAVAARRRGIARRVEAADGKSRGNGESLESIVHGLNETARGAEPDSRQLGSAKKTRQPSPMMWRLFKVPAKDAYLPVMTWFPTGYTAAPVRLARDGAVFKYLHSQLGFETSLTGQALAASNGESPQ